MPFNINVQCEMSILHLSYKIPARLAVFCFLFFLWQELKRLKIKTDAQRWLNPVWGGLCKIGLRGVPPLFGSDKAPDQTVIIENANKALPVDSFTLISTNEASVAKAGFRRSGMIRCA